MVNALCFLLAGAFLYAGAAKARDLDGLRSALRTVASDRVATTLTWVTPVAEIGLATVLLLGGGRVAAGVALAILLAFQPILTAFERSGAPCPCFGAGAAEPAVVSRVRTSLLAVAALVLVIKPVGAVWTAEAGEIVGAVTVAIGAACAWHLSWHRRVAT